MKILFKLMSTGLALVILGAWPALADPGNGKGHGNKNSGYITNRDYRGHDRHVANCPPGLAKKSPACVPPGQAKHYGNRVGDVLRIGDYNLIRDPRRYDLETRRGWDYYRDDDRVYRVDRDTRKVLAVLELIDAFSR